jgi:hypothetical protein
MSGRVEKWQHRYSVKIGIVEGLEIYAQQILQCKV